MKVQSVHPKTFPNMTDGLFLNALPVPCYRQVFFGALQSRISIMFPPRGPPKTDPKMDLSWTSSWEGFWASKTRPRWPKLALRWPQDELKTAPRRVNLAPQDEHKLGPILERSLGFQNEPKMAQVGPKMAPIWIEEGLQGTTGQPKMSQDMPKTR